MATLKNTPCVIIIRDGWGRNPNPEHDAFNAIHLAQTPIDDRLEAGYPSALIATSGEDVGLPDRTMGNSEVGHQNIGAGRIVDQDSVRISKSIQSGAFTENEALRSAIEGARRDGRAVHLMGLASDAGVHARLDHMYACLDLCASVGQERVLLHLFMDGRDTGPFTGRGFVEQVQRHCEKAGVGRIASVMGRYYAMDRDNRWERVELAFACLTGHGSADNLPRYASAGDAVDAYYSEPTSDSMQGDEFVYPSLIGRDQSDADSMRFADGDSVIFWNYRGDRPRELCHAFLDPEFEGKAAPSPDSGARGFDRGARLDLRFVAMTGYSEEIAELASVAFPKPPAMKNILGQHLAAHGLAQFRCAETEKFPHVTFFFNDYRGEPFPGEHRAIIQSPRVATYDLQPEMSADGVCGAVLERLDADDCEPVIVVNFANPDMVGHTGKLDAIIKAVEIVDECVGAIVDKTLARGGSSIVFADHGNAEQTFDPETNAPHTAHTTYTVPVIVVGEVFRERSLREDGRLADIAPTALEMIGLEQPAEMTGRSLLT